MKTRSPVRRSIRRINALGILTMLILVGGLGGWAATTELAGAIVAPGQLVVETDIKMVQHPTGGIVGELLVREGSRVEAGEVVIRLDPTLANAELAIVVGRLDELLSRRALLTAERDGLDAIEVPPDLAARAGADGVAMMIAAVQGEFALRRSSLESQKAQLREQVTQLGEQIQGLVTQSDAKTQELALVDEELVGLRQLLGRELIERSQVTALERESARLAGEIGQLASSIAATRGRTSEIEIQILSVDQDRRSAAATELAQLNANVAELQERRVKAEDQLARLEIRSPQAGAVHELAVHTIGAVIGPGERLMEIVPLADALVVEARLSPTDRDQLTVGQTASLQFSAFNQQTTPRINGIVSTVSPNTSLDERTGVAYYTVRITMDATEVERLGDVEMVPGMIVSAFIATRSRTVASFLFKPLMDQMERAFRER